MLLGKAEKEYFGWKVKESDGEWQGSYENPSQPARYHGNDAWKYWRFLLPCFLSGVNSEEKCQGSCANFKPATTIQPAS